MTLLEVLKLKWLKINISEFQILLLVNYNLAQSYFKNTIDSFEYERHEIIDLYKREIEKSQDLVSIANQEYIDITLESYDYEDYYIIEVNCETKQILMEVKYLGNPF